jgi:hypothetical protein
MRFFSQEKGRSQKKYQFPRTLPLINFLLFQNSLIPKVEFSAEIIISNIFEKKMAKKFSLEIVGLLSIVLAFAKAKTGSSSPCWVTNWNELYRIQIPKNSPLYSSKYSDKQVIKIGEKTYWQYHHFSLC